MHNSFAVTHMPLLLQLVQKYLEYSLEMSTLTIWKQMLSTDQ